MNAIVFLLLAYLGGIIGVKLKLPAGALLGSMLMVGVFSIVDMIDSQEIPHFIRNLSKVALGTMIGLMFTKNILYLPFKKLISFIILGFGSVISAVVVAMILKGMGMTPFIMTLVSVSPGGIAEMLTLADSIHTDTQVVAIMHLIRFVTLMLLLRWILKTFNKQGEKT